MLFADKATALSGNANVDAMYVLDRNALRSRTGFQRIKAELDVIRFLRSKKFDTVICTFPEDRFVAWAFLSGAAVRIGQKAQPLSWLLSSTPDIRKNSRGVLEYYCDLVGSLGAKVESTSTECFVPVSSVRRMDEALAGLNIDRTKDLVAVHPGATGDYKIWPPERFAALIDHLQRRCGVQVVLCSGALDKPVLDAIEQRLHKRVAVVDTSFSIGDLAAVLQRSLLCVSNDSGPRHLAVAVGTPTLALFRQFHEREWKIYPESPTCVTLVGLGQCPVCPAGACLDRIPEGEQYGSYCLRMVSLERAVEQIEHAVRASRAKREHMQQG
jgi:ADP-heptose:LPS heptosyltransferase